MDDIYAKESGFGIGELGIISEQNIDLSYEYLTALAKRKEIRDELTKKLKKGELSCYYCGCRAVSFGGVCDEPVCRDCGG